LRNFLLLGLLSAFLPPDAIAESWHCRNEQYEISCTGKECELETLGGFTPLHVDIIDDKIVVGRYESTWTGKVARKLRQGSYTIIVSHKLRDVRDPDNPTATLSMTIDRSSKAAVMLGMNFAHPMDCRPATEIERKTTLETFAEYNRH